MKPLKPGMFYEAYEAKLPLHCLCLEYGRPQDAWIDDEVGHHFLKCFSQWSRWTMTVDLYLKESSFKSQLPKEQCEEVYQWMCDQLKIHHSS